MRMRVAQYFLLALTLGNVLPPAVSAQSAGAGSSNLLTYSNPQYEFSLQYPAGLTPRPVDGSWSAAEDLSFESIAGTPIVSITISTPYFTASLSARYHHGSPEEYLKQCVETFKMGLGMPAMFNDEVIVPALMNRKLCREDACNYAMVGCVEVAVPGKWGYRCNGMSYFSMLKVFELAMNDGRDQKTGKQLCKGTGILEEFRSFEDVAEAFEKQIRFYTRLYITHDMIADYMTERYLPVFQIHSVRCWCRIAFSGGRC